MDSNFQVKITADLGDLVAKIKNIETTLAKLDGSFKGVSGRATTSLQNTGQAAASAGLDMNRMRLASFALGQVIRDSGFFAQSFGLGLLAISNNIPILIDQLVMLSNVSKGLGIALSMMGSILTAALTIFAYASMGADKYNDSLDKIRATAETNVINLNALLAIAKDETLSYSTRQEAINKLNQDYDIFNENLTIQTVNSEKTQAAVDALTKSIYLQAEAQVLQSEIQDEIAKRRKLEATDLKDQAGLYDKVRASLGFFNSTLGTLRKATSVGDALNKIAESQRNYNKSVTESGLKNFNSDIQASDDNLNKLTKSVRDNYEALATLGQLDREDKKDGKTEKELNKIKQVYADLAIEIKKVDVDLLSSNLEKATKKVDAHRNALQSLIELGVEPLSEGYKEVSNSMFKAAQALLSIEGKIFAAKMQSTLMSQNAVKAVQDEAAAKKKILDEEKKLQEISQYPEQGPDPIADKNKKEEKAAKVRIGQIEYLRQSVISLGNVVSGPLASAFERMFATGDFGFKALGDALKQVLAKLVAAVAAAAALALIFSLLTGGTSAVAKGGGFAKIFQGIIGGKGLIPRAKGGIFTGPSAALIGEYPGARNNPEVVAPLDKLKSLIGDSGAGSGGGFTGKLETRISGNDLVILMNRANKNRNGYY